MQLMCLSKLFLLQLKVLISCLADQILNIVHDATFFLFLLSLLHRNLLLLHPCQRYRLICLNLCQLFWQSTFPQIRQPLLSDMLPNLSHNSIIDPPHEPLVMLLHLLWLEPSHPLVVMGHFSPLFEEHFVDLAEMDLIRIVLVWL